MAPACTRKRNFHLLVQRDAAGQNADMEQSPQLEAYFELCKRIYERMEREGTWPWPPDSTNPENMIDSDFNQHDV